MKKLLACLLVIVMAVTVFTGCKENKTEKPSNTGSTSDVTTPTPTPTEPTGTGDETTFPTIDPEYVAKKNDVIKFRVYDKDDCMTRWSLADRDRMKEELKLEFEFSVPMVTGEGIGTYTKSAVLLPTEDIVNSYTEALSLLFLQDETTPDYFPSLYGTVTGCPAAKSLGKDHFVNLAPYIEEGRTLQNYLLWLWEDDRDYFDGAKDALMTSEGAIYALPRREMMAVNKFLAYNKVIFDKQSISWSQQPKTWEEFVALLKQAKQIEGVVPFIMTEARLENLLGFIASTYGLDFNVDFSWTEKNGEPLWTYFWADYLQILEQARMMGEEGLTMTDKNNPKLVVHYDMDDSAKGRQAWARKDSASGWARLGEVGNAVAVYATSAIIGGFDNSGWGNDDQRQWYLADNWVTQENREFSLIGGTQFAQSYIAIGNRIDKQRGDKEFTLRILEFLNYSMTDNGYKEYFFGREGIPFGEDVKNCGAWIWDTDPITGEKAVRFSIEDRMGFNVEKCDPLLEYLNKNNEGTEEVTYKRQDGKTDKEFWISVDENYGILIEKAKGDWAKAYDTKIAPDPSDWIDDGCYKDYRDYGAKVEFTKPVYRSLANYKYGTIMYGDVTSYPMQMTVYWNYQESMSSHSAYIEKYKEKCEETNSYIYSGFYKDASFLGTTDASKLQQKMDNIKTIAREFTIGFLSNERQSTDWSNYINSLREAGYQDVYDFYNGGGRIATVTKYNENTMSQSKVEEYRNK